MKNFSFNARTNGLRMRSGFTLIEILIVIAIIGLLAGIAFPVFSRARENGRKTVCASNLKQIGLGFAQYIQDTGGRLPAAGAFTKWGNGGHWVAGKNGDAIASLGTQKPLPDGCAPAACNKANVEKGALYPYIRSTAVYTCPSNRDGESKGLTYSMNCSIGLMGEVRIKTPADIVLLVDEEKANDGFFFAAGDPGDTKLYPQGITDNGKSTDKLAEYHNGGGNLLFVDGHVKFSTFKAFPVDDSVEGLANKSKMIGSPRFHDASFGTYGSFSPTGSDVDACAVKLPKTGTTVPPGSF